jgi:hypothetical protein
LCGVIQSIHRFEKCRNCGEPSFKISSVERVLLDAVKTDWVCNCCTMTNKIDFNNLNSAICEACEKEYENITKQIVAALKSKPAPKDKWKFNFCKKINFVEWNRVGSSVCKFCNEKDFEVQKKKLS